MPLNRDDIENYQCPDCTRLGSYRLDWPGGAKPAVYRCCVCGREINEGWLEREIRNKRDGEEKLSNVLIIIMGVVLPIAFIVFVLLKLK